MPVNIGEGFGLKLAIIDAYSKPLRDYSSKVEQAEIKSKGLRDFVKKNEQHFRSMGLAATVAGGAIVAGLGFALHTAGKFEYSMANVGAVAGATSEQMKELSEFARKMGADTVFSASQAADAMYYLASAGYDVNKMMKALPGTLDLAAATQYDLAETTRIVVSTLNQFEMQAEDATKVANTFAAIIGSSQATMDRLGISMQYVGPVAAGLGYTLEETAAALGVLYNAGIDASMAGTALRGALSRLMDPTKEMRDTLAELNLTIEDVSPTTHKFTEIIETLNKAGITTEQTMKLFGLRAGPAMVRMLATGSEALKELENRITGTNKAAEMSERQINTWQGTLKLLKSAVEEVQLVLGDVLLPTLTPMIKNIKDIVRSIGEWTKAHPKITSALVKFAMVLGGLLAVGGPLLMMAPTIMKTVGAIGFFISVLSKLGPALMAAFAGMGPGGWIILGLTVAAAGLYLLYQRSETFRKSVQKAGAYIEWFGRIIIESFKSVGINIGNFIDWFISNFPNIFIDAGKAVLTVFTNLGKNITSWVGWVIKKLNPKNWFKKIEPPDWTPLLEGFKPVTEKLPKMVGVSVDRAFTILENRLEEVEKNINETSRSALDAASSTSQLADEFGQGAEESGKFKRELSNLNKELVKLDENIESIIGLELAEWVEESRVEWQMFYELLLRKFPETPAYGLAGLILLSKDFAGYIEKARLAYQEMYDLMSRKFPDAPAYGFSTTMALAKDFAMYIEEARGKYQEMYDLMSRKFPESPAYGISDVTEKLKDFAIWVESARLGWQEFYNILSRKFPEPPAYGISNIIELSKDFAVYIEGARQEYQEMYNLMSRKFPEPPAYGIPDITEKSKDFAVHIEKARMAWKEFYDVLSRKFPEAPAYGISTLIELAKDFATYIEKSRLAWQEFYNLFFRKFPEAPAYGLSDISTKGSEFIYWMEGARQSWGEMYDLMSRKFPEAPAYGISTTIVATDSLIEAMDRARGSVSKFYKKFYEWEKIVAPVKTALGEVTDEILESTITWREMFAGFYEDMKGRFVPVVEEWMRGLSTWEDFTNRIWEEIKTSFYRSVAEMASEWIAKQVMMTLATIAGAKTRQKVEEKSILAIVAKYLWGMGVMLAKTVFTVMKEIALFTAKAAAAAYAAFAGIPFVGPILGLAAAGAVVAGIGRLVAGIIGFEKGGMAKGGFEPLEAQGGAIVTKPTLGLVGEGGRPEAIIPLEGGAVPVKLIGGRAGNIIRFGDINVTIELPNVDLENLDQSKINRIFRLKFIPAIKDAARSGILSSDLVGELVAR
ncbi:MAG: phage tail tape measure protein [Candidatus Omnitrophota bacterium]|nr:MAG: phage tail tape measure protein [Candidatus Omnitrophota bacterium]